MPQGVVPQLPQSSWQQTHNEIQNEEVSSHSIATTRLLRILFRLGITSMKATSWQRHKLVDLKALPSLCSICGLITLTEAKRLCASYKYLFPETLDTLITLTDKKYKNKLSVSIPLDSLSVRPKTPTGCCCCCCLYFCPNLNF